MVKEVPTPDGIRFFISAQTVACNTFSSASAVVDSDDGPAVNSLWPDRTWPSVPVVVRIESVFSVVEDEPDNGVLVCMTALDVPDTFSGSDLVLGIAASGSVNDFVACFLASGGLLGSACRNWESDNGLGS